MGLFDKIKKMDVSGALGAVADKVSDSISDTVSGVAERLTQRGDDASESHEQQVAKQAQKTDTPLQINTLEQMTDWVRQLQTEASGPALQALQSQLQVLRYVESPSMTSMALDNILVALHKSLKEAEEPRQRELLQETFASLLQSFVFLSEARLQHEIDTNQKQTIQLLSEAGDFLANSVLQVTTLVATGGASAVVQGASAVAKGASTVARVMPVVNNVMAATGVQKSFLGRLISAKGKKAEIEARKTNFYKSIEYMFDTLDRYAELIGRSIQIHGMLKRYADQLIDRFSHNEIEAVQKTISEQEVAELEALTGKVKDKESFLVAGFKMLAEGVKQATQKEEVLTFDKVQGMQRQLQSKVDEATTHITYYEKEIRERETEIKGLGMLQMGRKKKLREEIDTLRQQIQQAEIDQLNAQNRLHTVEVIVRPVVERVDAYRQRLYQTVEKFAYTF